MWNFQSMIAGAGQGTMGILTSIYGGINAGKKRKQMENYLGQQESENQAWYNSRAMSDYTQRSDSLAIIRNQREALREGQQRAANMAVVTGATPEAQAMQQQEANRSLTDTYSRLGAMGQQWKDSIENTYLNRKHDLQGQRMSMLNQQAQNYENLLSQGLQTLADSNETFGKGMFSK
jgi:hypothetical protein